MKKLLPQFFLLLASFSCFQAQKLNLDWSEKLIYDNKLDGFFDDYVGANSSYVYAKFSNLALSRRKKDRKVKLIAFNKTTMKKEGEAVVFDYKVKEQGKEDMKYYRTIVLENVIYVLWELEEAGVTFVYAETFSAKLKKLANLKKIYEYNSAKKNVDNMFLIYNKNIGNKILIGREYASVEDNENLRIEYKIVNENFVPEGSAKITLPVVVIKKKTRNGIICTYEFGDDENLYISDKVKIINEEKKKLKKGQASTYPIIMQVQTKTGKLHTFNVLFAQKNTFNFSWKITKNAVKLYGFFCDLNKDEKGNDTHGIFYLSMDPNTFKPKDEKFSYFDKSFLDKLYAADQENQKKAKRRGKEKDKKSDEESIDDYYVIEQSIDDGKDIVLFCSIMYNWEQTICTTNSNGGTTCNTYYYCTKNNVTAFKLSATGDIIWASNLDRTYTFRGWNVYDVKVVKKDDNYLVLYESSYQIKAEKKNKKSRKSKEQMNDRLEYAVFDGRTGAYQKAEHQVNAINTKKADKKSINTSGIDLFENKMYTNSTKIKYRPTFWLSCLCPPVWYVLNFSGNSRIGSGYLGTINVSN